MKPLVFYWAIEEGGAARRGPFTTMAQALAKVEAYGGLPWRAVSGTLRKPQLPLPQVPFGSRGYAAIGSGMQ